MRRTITVVDGIDVKDWDTALTYGHESYVMNNIYDGLLRYNTAAGKLEPALATEWKVSDDGLKWTYKIREGVKYHSGEALNAKTIATALALLHQAAARAPTISGKVRPSRRRKTTR